MSLLDWLRGPMARAPRNRAPAAPEPLDGIVEQADQDPGVPTGARAPRRVARPGGAATAMAPADEDSAHEVAGERTIASVNRERTVQSRIGNALALGSILLLGGGFLAWYYSAQFARAQDARAAAAKAAEARTAAEMKLPPLGRLDPPVAPAPPGGTITIAATDVLGPAPPAPPPPQPVFGPGAQPAAQQPPPKTPEQMALERMLNEPVVRRRQPAGGSMPAASMPQYALPPGAGLGAVPGGMAAAGAPGRTPGEPAGGTPLAGLLQPTPTPAVEAQVVPTRRFLLPKGAFVDCTLETAIDSTYDGMVTCVGATDVYGADGKVVLLERGTKYIGEKRGEVRQGQGRVFVLWSEARTPTGVVARLDSPGTDELGRTGLPGHVDTHFWERFGAAILISVVDGALRALSTTQGGTTIQLNPTGSRDVIAEVLRNTVAIPPTVIKNQGDRIQVLVARDVDFRPVYALRSASN